MASLPRGTQRPLEDLTRSFSTPNSIYARLTGLLMEIRGSLRLTDLKNVFAVEEALVIVAEREGLALMG
jgi:hypothetical protein